MDQQSARALPIAGARSRPRLWIANHRVELLLISALVLVAVIIRLPTLDQPLLEEGHGFRQTETAYPALLFHTQGINLFAPQLPVLGRPWQVPFEFPIFQALAALLMNAGLTADVAVRVVALASFMACALLTWGLVRHLSNRLVAGVALAVFVLLPYDILWSRAANIDYLATALGIGWAWLGILWLDRRRAWLAIPAVAVGSLALLVKPLDAIFWLTPVLLYRSASGPRGWVNRLRGRLVAVGALAVIPLALTLIWTLHTDSIKAASPATAWLTNGSLTGFYLGTVGQRLSASEWSVIAGRLQATGFPGWLLALLFVAVCVRAVRARQSAWIGIALTSLLPILAFFNGYVANPYYLVAITPALAAMVGYTFDWVFRAVRLSEARFVASGVLVVWLAVTLYSAGALLNPIYQGKPYRYLDLTLAHELAVKTKATDLIVFDGFSWNPSIPYYSRRRGMMLFQQFVTQRLLDSLPGQGYKYFFLADQNGVYPVNAHDAFERWAWFGTVSRHLFVLGESRADVGQARLLGTWAGFIPADGARSVTSEPTPVRCDGRSHLLVSNAPAGVTLALSDPSPTASLRIRGQWIPAAPTIVVTPAAQAGSQDLRVQCAGALSVDVSAVYALSE